MALVPELTDTTSLLIVLAAMTATTGLLSGWLAFQRRNAAGGLPLAALCTTTVGWILAYTAQLLSTDVTQKLVWVDIGWVPAALAPVCWLLFALEYTGRDRHVTTELLALLLFVPALSTILLWTNDAHSLVLVDYEFTTYGAIQVIDWQYGPVFWLTIGYSYVLVLAGAFLVGETVVDSLDVYRFQSAVLLTAALIPITASILSVGFETIPIDGTPFAFAASDALCVLAITRFDLLESRPVPQHLARGGVMNALSDAVVVTDTRGYVTDANPAAHALFDTDAGTLVGRHIETIRDRHIDASSDSETAIHDAEFVVGNETRYFDVERTHLTDSNDRPVGHLLSLHDVTDRRHRLQQVSVLNRVLRHDLRTRTNLILGYTEMATSAVHDDARDEALDRLATVEAHTRALEDAAEKVRSAEDLLSPDPERTARSLDALLTAIVDDLQSTYPDVDIRIRDETAAVTVPALTRVVLRNLIENAVEHNDAPDPYVEVTTAVRNQETVHIEISDNGPGIPAYELDVLDEQETPLHHGSGVGLWLVHWGIDVIGGSLAFRTVREGAEMRREPASGPERATMERQRGTTVSVVIPVIP